MTRLTEQRERQILAALLATWGYGPVFWTDAEYAPPPKTGNPAAPAALLVLEIEERDSGRVTFGGVGSRRRTLTIDCLVEREAREGELDRRIDRIFELLATAATLAGKPDPDLDMIDERAPSLGEVVALGEAETFRGRRIQAPYRTHRVEASS